MGIGITRYPEEVVGEFLANLGLLELAGKFNSMLINLPPHQQGPQALATAGLTFLMAEAGLQPYQLQTIQRVLLDLPAKDFDSTFVCLKDGGRLLLPVGDEKFVAVDANSLEEVEDSDDQLTMTVWYVSRFAVIARKAFKKVNEESESE